MLCQTPCSAQYTINKTKSSGVKCSSQCFRESKCQSELPAETFSCCRPSFIHDNWSRGATPLMEGDDLRWCRAAACGDIMQLISESDRQLDICIVSVQMGALQFTCFFSAMHLFLLFSALLLLVFHICRSAYFSLMLYEQLSDNLVIKTVFRTKISPDQCCYSLLAWCNYSDVMCNPNMGSISYLVTTVLTLTLLTVFQT